MKEDFKKFVELVNTDEALQKKLEEAAKNYDGEQSEGAAFEAIIVPAAKEVGLNFTLDEYLQSAQELNSDEMSQVSGGAGGGGVGVVACEKRGWGVGWAAGVDDDGKKWGGGACFIIGGGMGAGLCLATGWTNNPFK